MKDKNADKRFEYNQAITAKEREADDLKLESRQTVAAIENFENLMMRSFRNIQAIEEDVNRRSQNSHAFNETAQKQSFIKRLIDSQAEEATMTYRSAADALEEERAQLQKERDSLAWD